MRTRRGRALAALGAATALATIAGCSGSETISGGPDPSRVDLGEIRLVAHDSCDSLLDWFHDEAGARVGPYGLEGTGPYPMPGMFLEDSASSSGSDGSGSAPRATASAESSASTATDGGTSSTNTQEPGVGEPDLVWTDGSRLITVVNQALQVVDLQAGALTAELDLAPEGGDGWYAPVGLLVEGDHAVVLQRSDAVYALDGVAADVATSRAVGDGGDATSWSAGPTTVLTRVDLGATPTVVGSVEVDGSYVDARMVDGVVRTVVRATPTDLGFVYPSGSGQAAVDRATEANRDVVASSTLDDWLPSMTVTTGDGQTTTDRAVGCTAVDHPTTFAGFGVVTVIGLDLGAGSVEPMPSTAVVADAETVYSSSDALYVATTRYPGAHLPYEGSATTTSLPADDTTVRTEVHAFSLPADAAARYEASGAVPGTVVDQFALSEHDGDLRVATTLPAGGTWGGPIPVEEGPATGPAVDTTVPAVSESRITVLRRDGEGLAPVGEVTGLGPTEQIRGVRFAGPTAYVVTFRQTDPLFVVDLTDPTAPRVAGELKIPGYSSYLQVLDDGRVLGIGQDATDTGRATGLQESLFDVSDPANPTRVAQLVVPGATSTAEYDHHALLWWPATDLLAVPVERWGAPEGGLPDTGVLVTTVADDSITELGVVTHPASGVDGVAPGCPPDANCVSLPPSPTWPTPIARTVVADGRLVTVSTAGVKVSDLSTLADLAWIPLT